MIEILTNLKLIFFIMLFIILFIFESFYSEREWTSKRFLRLFFHAKIAIINRNKTKKDIIDIMMLCLFKLLPFKIFS